MTERSGSAIHRLPALLVEQPVVDIKYVSEHLHVPTRTAENVVKRACEYDILQPLGGRRRGSYYQSSGIIDALEPISNLQGIRRIIYTGKFPEADQGRQDDQPPEGQPSE